MAAPGGYYNGPPAVPHKAPPSEPEPEPVDGQVNAVPGYYNGAPASQAAARGGKGSSTPPKESGFFASCCPCFSGGATA